MLIWSEFGLLLLGLLTFGAIRADNRACPHCAVGDAFEEFLRQTHKDSGSIQSDVSVLWATHVEVIPLTEEIGGWESPSFHRKLAAEAIREWQNFRNKIFPSLPENHSLVYGKEETFAGSLNDAFFDYQRKLFDHHGDLQAVIDDKEEGLDDEDYAPPRDGNASWPAMDALPEYQKLRKLVERLSRRYLIRSGMKPEAAHSLNTTTFAWAAVHGPGEFHQPHTHIGEYHVGVFYAQIGPAAGKLLFLDPRGRNPPFGRYHYHTPKAGQLIFFPAWLGHMATVTAAASDITRGGSRQNEPYRVVFSFNIGPEHGRLRGPDISSDPTGDMGFTRSSMIDRETFRL